MKSNTTAVVIGAGPYGLSVAAHLKAHNIPTQIFGKTMEFWEKMPTNMYLKSTWGSANLSGPGGHYKLNDYGKLVHTREQKPVALSFFLDYCRWFQEETGVKADHTYVQSVVRDGENFRVELADGRTLEASHVVVAAGVAAFANIPQFALDLPPTLAAHTQEHTDLTPFKEKNVAVVGGGQSALEYAALLHEAGARVEVIARESIIWIDRKLYDSLGPTRRIFYPPSDIGPAGLSWVVAFPTFFSRLPDNARNTLDTRCVRPSGAQWLRPRVDGKIPLTPNTEIVKAVPQGEGLRCTLSDGTTRDIDYLFFGTGYKPSIDKFSFLDPSLRDQIQQHDGYPLQNISFESSVPRLYFAGTITAYTFGPICRFVTGSDATANQISRHIVRTATSVRMPVLA